MSSINPQWRPSGTVGRWQRRRPEVGDLVAWEHAAWRVMHVKPAEPNEDERECLAAYRTPIPDRLLPYKMTLRREHGPEHPEHPKQVGNIAVRVPAIHWYWEFYEDDQVPLCSCCGHPWPCLMREARVQSERAGEALRHRLARVAPGVCYGCGEVITQRQKSVVFPEPNLQVPGAPPPRFHTRRKCAGELLAYEQLRAERLPESRPVHFHVSAGGVWRLL